MHVSYWQNRSGRCGGLFGNSLRSLSTSAGASSRDDDVEIVSTSPPARPRKRPLASGSPVSRRDVIQHLCLSEDDFDEQSG